MPKDKPTLPTNRAFVVQLRGDAAVEQGDFRGRVEHFTSGEATHFKSVEELTAFIARVIATLKVDDCHTPDPPELQSDSGQRKKRCQLRKKIQ